MRLLHDPLKISASFDDPDLVSRAGLVPVMALAERAGLHGLTRRHVRIAGRAGAYPEVKVACLVAGMAAGADSTGDMDLLRHGAMPDLFGGVRAPSTLGSFLRSFTGGNVRQLEQVSRELPPELARRAPLLPGADQLAFAGIDSMQRRACGYKKQGAAFGHTKISGKTVLVRGLNALAATISTPQAGPVIAGTRLRGGSANTARGAASFTAEALGTARGAGCAGMIVARAEAQHRDHAVVEQVFADWTDGPMAHLPSGSFAANAAWLTCAAISANLIRAAGCLASPAHARARGATIRRDLIDVAARAARRGRGNLILHLPEYWHRETEWRNLFEAACGPPRARAA